MNNYPDSIKVEQIDIEDEGECDYCYKPAVRQINISRHITIDVCRVHLNGIDRDPSRKTVPVCSPCTGAAEFHPLTEEAMCEYCYKMATRRIDI